RQLLRPRLARHLDERKHPPDQRRGRPLEQELPLALPDDDLSERLLRGAEPEGDEPRRGPAPRPERRRDRELGLVPRDGPDRPGGRRPAGREAPPDRPEQDARSE